MTLKVYIETTIISYLTGRPSRDLIQAAHQQITSQWWHERRRSFELFTSQAVVDEAGAGDQGAAHRRLEALEPLPLLEINDDVTSLAGALIEAGPLPEKAAVDAVHIAASARYGMDYLLTWNCTHIANAAMRDRIERVCRSKNYDPPIMCTPEELLEE